MNVYIVKAKTYDPETREKFVTDFVAVSELEPDPNEPMFQKTPLGQEIAQQIREFAEECGEVVTVIELKHKMLEDHLKIVPVRRVSDGKIVE